MKKTVQDKKWPLLFFLRLMALGAFLFLVYSFSKNAEEKTPISYFQMDIVNTSSYSNPNLYWTIVCQNRNGLYSHMDKDGTLKIMSKSDNSHAVGTALNCDSTNEFANYSFKLSTSSSVKIYDTALINSAILYISLDSFLPLCVLSDSLGYAPPSYNNPELQGYNNIIQAVEFAYNVQGEKTLNINTTNVDEVGLAIKVKLEDSLGTQTDSVGFTIKRSKLIDEFASCVDTNFHHLIIPNSSGKDTLRILSPEHVTSNLGIDSTVVNYFEKFYNNYIDSCWNFYADSTLVVSVDSQFFSGVMHNDILTFTPLNATDTTAPFSFTKPTNSEVMQANGQFIAGSVDQQNVGKQIAAAMFRTVFMEMPTDNTNTWCSSSMKGKYFTNPPINYYGKILHKNSINGLCYAYGYSDVCGESSSLSSTTTNKVEIIITD